MSGNVTGWVIYANWERVDQLALEGWETIPDLAPTHHDKYGTMMKWVGLGDPPGATIDDKTDAMIAEFRDESGLFQP